MIIVICQTRIQLAILQEQSEMFLICFQTLLLVNYNNADGVTAENILAYNNKYAYYARNVWTFFFFSCCASHHSGSSIKSKNVCFKGVFIHVESDETVNSGTVRILTISWRLMHSIK